LKKIIALILSAVLLIYYAPDIKKVFYEIKDFATTVIDEDVSSEDTKESDEEQEKSIEEDPQNFETIKIGDDLESVEKKVGKPTRIDESGYSFKWNVYNQFGEKFFMIGIEDKKVVALYSNYFNSEEINDLKINTSDIKSVRERYTPLEYFIKSNIKFLIQSNQEYDIVSLNNNYITFFYDKFDDNKLTSYQVISQEVEDNSDVYKKETKELIKSYELEIFDLANSTRMQKQMDKYLYSDKCSQVAKNHCKDMIEKKYFDHIDKDKKGPADRMTDAGIDFQFAGENIAAGQLSAIYAHEGWMNSEGHRKNILGKYKYIGVGVQFGGEYNVYYAQNFYR
jgi:uncharacterized protein YkwD